MKKLLKSRNLLITVLCFTILLLSIGFMILSVKFNKIKDREEVFDVSIESVVKASSFKGVDVEPISSSKIINNKKEVEFNFTMNHARDEVTYIITIKNNGTMSAQIVDLLLSPDYLNEKTLASIYPIDISLTDLDNQVLEPNGEIEAKLIVTYNPSVKEDTKKNINFKIGVIAKSR